MPKVSQEQNATVPAWTAPRLVKCGSIKDVAAKVAGANDDNLS